MQKLMEERTNPKQNFCDSSKVSLRLKKGKIKPRRFVMYATVIAVVGCDAKPLKE